ncbi:small ubiquitin-like modifier 1 [Amylocarpus encephaloides]|uniref:Small ubiquitin-like modifier 1 n=1 Tax=Amylocarpus encephaloides TaxID=45428 RepID=A0A9P7Y5Y7_9HELO|nr:small ubiquitin-like modifier 1 [Amylocarpus encephaloides]
MSDIEAPSRPALLSLTVRDQANNEIAFRVKAGTKLEKLMSAYSKERSLGLSSLRFFFDNHRIQKFETPQSLNMEDNDIIDVHLEQTGGCAWELSRGIQDSQFH